MAQIVYRSCLFTFVLLVVPFLSVQSCAQGPDESNAAAEVTSDTPAEREIRAGYCDYQRKNYAGAQSHFSKALELDPDQKDAPFLIATMLERQVKPGDKSAANIALARQAIAGYQKTIGNPLSDSARKEEADKAMLRLYGQISREELQREFLSRATSTTRPKEKRAEAYTVLASQAWDCSYRVTERSDTKRQIERNGKIVVQYVRPADPALFEKAHICATNGMEYAKLATSLDAKNESAWSYQGLLFRELAKIAEMGTAPEKKLEFEKQAAAAETIATRLAAERSKKDDEAQGFQTKEPDSLAFSVDELTSEQIKRLTTEFTYFKSEPKISELVQDIYDSLETTTLVAPVPVAGESGEDEETTGRKRAEAALQLKHEWKEFKPEGEEFSVFMPSLVQHRPWAKLERYETSSEGIGYTIFSLKKPEPPEGAPTSNQATYDSMMLNATASATAPLLSSFRRGNDSGAVVEVKLLRKETVSGRQSRQYAITVVSCDKTTHSVLNYYAGNKHIYILLIHGVDENDQRVLQLLRSWRIS